MMHRAAILLAIASLFAANGCNRASRAKIERVEWPVMGTVAALQFEGEVDKKALAAVKDVFSKVEKLLNAHDPKSELSLLATLGDVEVLNRADPLVRNCYEEAFEMRDLTSGAFDPRWRGDKTLDLGAIAKGYAVDLAAHALSKLCAKRTLVDLGGNLKAVGGDWRVNIAYSPEVLVLSNGMAVATSAKYFRGEHIKDARTGRPAVVDFMSVSVIHPFSAAKADALSTAMFILGREKGEAFLRKHSSLSKAIFINYNN